MAINRFSQGPIAADVQSKYIPMPLDLMARQLQLRQSQYDKAKQTIDASQEAVYGVKGLSQDRDTLSTISKQYETEIDKAIEESGGDYSRLTAFSDQLGKKVSRDIKTGHLSAIHNNFVRAQNHMQELAKSKKEGKISEAGYNQGLNSISAFGGTVEDGQGGYTSASLYTPTKYLEIGKTADEYGSRIKDQYDSKGQRFINARTASRYIEKNLWNNPQVIANAKEQIWNTYNQRGVELSPEQSHQALKAFMKDRALAAGRKIAFQQINKKTGTDDKTGGTRYSYTLQGKKPMSAQLTLGGKATVAGVIDQAVESGEVSGWKTALSSAPFLAPGVPVVAGVLEGVDKAANMLGMDFTTPVEYREQYLQEEQQKALVEQKKVAKAMLNNDMLRDLLQVNGVALDPENISNEALLAAKEAVDGINGSSAGTTITWERSEGDAEDFEWMIRTGDMLHKNIINMDTGERLNREEIERIRNSFFTGEANKDNTGPVYSGEIGPGQAYGSGSKVFMALNEDNEAQNYVIESNLVNSKNYTIDRALWAISNNSGTAAYRTNEGEVVLLNTGNTTPQGAPILNKYINGKKAGTIVLGK